jgi:hypothetical protein
MIWPIDGAVDLEVFGSIYEIKPERHLGVRYLYRGAQKQIDEYAEAAGPGFHKGGAHTLGLAGGAQRQFTVQTSVGTQIRTYNVSLFYDPTSATSNSGLLFYSAKLQSVRQAGWVRSLEGAVQQSAQRMLTPPIPSGSRSIDDF